MSTEGDDNDTINGFWHRVTSKEVRDMLDNLFAQAQAKAAHPQHAPTPSRPEKE